jgi:hypothetical protein
MDPLDQHLRNAGAAWRQSQPEPPDLDRMIVALRRERSGLVPRRLMFAFVATLLLAAALAVAPGIGSFLHQLQPSTPIVVAPTPSPEPSQTPSRPSTSPVPSPTASASDSAVATDLVQRYESALVAGQWQTAFDLLAPTSLTHEAGLAQFSSERAAFFQSVKGRVTIGKPSPATDWASYGPVVTGADRTRAWLIEVDYPALSGNNAGFEQFVVAPDSGGTWRIWPVR